VSINTQKKFNSSLTHILKSSIYKKILNILNKVDLSNLSQFSDSWNIKNPEKQLELQIELRVINSIFI